jgi:hypothetical protein
MPVQYNPQTIDFSALAGIGQNIGGALGQHNLGTAMQDAMGPDGKTPDFNKMVSVLAGRGQPLAVAKLLTEQMQAEALGAYRMAEANTPNYQSDPYGRLFDSKSGNPPPGRGGGGGDPGNLAPGPGGSVNPHWYTTRNQDEAKAGSHYKTGAAANAELDAAGNVPAGDSSVSAFASGLAGGPTGEGMTGAVVNSFVSAKRQQFKNSAEAFINAINRRDSGATINASEWRNAEELYIPKSGDDPETVKLKALRRKRKLESIAGEAGPMFDPSAAAPEPIPTAAPATAQTLAPPTPVQTSTVRPDGTVVPPTEASAVSAVPGVTRDPRGPYNGPLPENTVINDGQQRLIKRNGKWVPYQ